MKLTQSLSLALVAALLFIAANSANAQRPSRGVITPPPPVEVVETSPR